jgi:hypothetical protein
MKRLGQIDQTITSVLVLFAVIFLLALFTYFTSSLRVVQDRTDIVFENHSVEKAAASSALLHSFISDRFMFKGERANVLEGLNRVSSAVDEYRVTDAGALSLLEAMHRYFVNEYGCGEKNSLVVLMKNPAGSAKQGSYWALINYPSESKEVIRLDAPLHEANIIDTVNGFVLNPELYSQPQFWFVPVLYETKDNGGAVYPSSDVLNELPKMVIVWRGGSVC